MKFRIKFAEQITGLFILIAIGFLALILIFMGVNQRWFKQNYHFYTYFDNAGGLKRGMQINMKGLQIGVVDKFYMSEDPEFDYMIRMDFHIYGEDVARIKEYAIINLVNNPLNIGGGLVVYTDKSNKLGIIDLAKNLSAGKKKNPIFMESPFTDKGIELLEQKLVTVNEDDDLINNTLVRVQNAVASIESILDKADEFMSDDFPAISSGLVSAVYSIKTSFQKMSTDGGMIDQITYAMSSITKMADKLTAEVGGLLNSAKSFMASLADGGKLNESLLSLINNLNTNSGTLLTTLNREIKSITNTVRKILGDIRTFSSAFKNPKGLIPKLFADEGGLYDNLSDTIKSFGGLSDNLSGQITSISENIDTLTGSISGSVKSLEDSMASINTIMDNLASLTSGMKNAEGLIPTLLGSEGSVGSLFNDNNAIYNDILGIISSLEEAMSQLKEFTSFINSTSPQITGILEEGKDALDEGKDVLEGLSNNPLISGGIPDEKEQPDTFQSFRDEDF